MRRVMVVACAALVLGALASPSYSVTHSGQGKDAPGGPNPKDYTATLPNLLGGGPLLVSAGETANGGVGVAVAIGDEGQPNSVIRVGASAGDSEQMAQSSLVSVYTEDYTAGNAIAGLINQVNVLTGCILIQPKPAVCAPSTDDASRNDIGDFILNPP